MTVYTMTIASRALCILALLSSSCATIPKEASELSAELGKRVSATESAHMALLHAYFAEKRDRVDEFLMKEWVPMFASELMKEPVTSRPRPS